MGSDPGGCKFVGNRAPGRQRGFALLIVLWMLVLITFIVGYVISTGRSEIQISMNIAGNAAASAAADGAVYQAIFALSNPREDQRPAADGSIRKIEVGRSVVTLRLQDENGRINPNLASARLLEGLLRAVGTEANAAADLADAITQWVGSASRLRSSDELAAEYRAAGLNYAPPETPLESIDELLRVRGMTAQEFAAIRPHLTLFGGRDPNAASADPIVAAAQRFADQSASSGPIFSGVGADAQIVRILVSAHGPGNTEVASTVIVRINSSDGGYSILEWRNQSG
jgi:general secretion pathway protein K